jgi:hypothetical protein
LNKHLKDSRSPYNFWPIEFCVFIDFGLEKNKKKYLEAPKSKMAAQFKMAAKI